MIIDDVLARYYPKIQDALQALFDPARDTGGRAEFHPGFRLPELTPAVREFLSVAELGYSELPSYGTAALSLLDLTRNCGTQTTKTLASLVMVARAVEFIRTTGQRVTIVTPSSANKAVALRDAVLRAITSGLVTASELNIVVLVPASSAHKLRCSTLLTDPELSRRNPIVLCAGSDPEIVKTIARDTVTRYRDTVEAASGTNLWYSLQIENYLAGDVVRAFAEAEFFPPKPDRPRLHVHAVSSAYGLLGHAYGRELLGDQASDPASRYFLVQHLGAPDMVLGLLANASGEAAGRPNYIYAPDSGCYVQSENPHFPAVTYDPFEVLDRTFYTRQPATTPRMSSLIESQGGGGIVVSFAECMERFGQARALIEAADIPVPANPSAILEWSLVMAVTGALNAVDRGLASEEDILVHGAGLYSRGDFDAVTSRDCRTVADSGSLRDVLIGARGATA